MKVKRYTDGKWVERMKPENMTNRPGDVRMKIYAIEQLSAQIKAIKRTMKVPDINGKLPGEYEE